MGCNNKLGCPSWQRTARGSHPARGAPGSFGAGAGLWGCCVLGSRHRICSPSLRGQRAAALPPPDLALPFGAENIPPGTSKFSTRAARRTVARGQTDGRPAARSPPRPHAGDLCLVAWAGDHPWCCSGAPRTPCPEQAQGTIPAWIHPGSPRLSPGTTSSSLLLPTTSNTSPELRPAAVYFEQSKRLSFQTATSLF